MFKKRSSEITFGLIEQTPDSCPHINDLLSSIENLFDRDEENDVEFDDRAVSDISAAIESLREWGNSWVEFEDDIIYPFLKKSLKELEIQEENEDMNDEDYNKLDNIQSEIEDLDDIIPDFKEDLKNIETNLLFSLSGLISDLSNGEESAYNGLDSFREEIKGYRETISEYKETIKEVAFNHFEDIPELSLLYKEHVQYMKKEQERKVKELKSREQKNKLKI
tara:strand:+ start:10205 stop:10870 length:666 start_codon:yes stop_codon:yes gene_type:complete